MKRVAQDGRRPETNLDPATVAGFGAEWQRFPYAGKRDGDIAQVYQDYFHLFPFAELDPRSAIGIDLGCGSGRWARFVAPRLHELHLLDASKAALDSAKGAISAAGISNVRFIESTIDAYDPATLRYDCAYSLGVMHHLPDTSAAIRSAAAMLKPGAPFLIYLYYRFENRHICYRALWRISDLFRRFVCRLPFPLRAITADLIAFTVYWPLARSARLLATMSNLPTWWPLSYYRDKSLYVLRTDALDRFGTRLERRFTRLEIAGMLKAAGFDRITFSDRPPFWTALAWKAAVGSEASACAG